jgi:hypothetical protein
MYQVKINDASLVGDDVWNLAIGDAQIEDVTVNGNPGVWIEDYLGYDGMKQHILLWEQNGYSFRLYSFLPREAMFTAAESITFVGPDDPDPLVEVPVSSSLLPVDVVAAQAGLTVAVPDDLPGGYILQSRYGRRLSEISTATTTYRAEDDTLTLIQSQYAAPVSVRDLVLGYALLDDVTVNQRDGIWIPDYQTYPDDRIGMLIWEQDGYIYKLQSKTLDRAEMIRIAESLRFVGG